MGGPEGTPRFQASPEAFGFISRIEHEHPRLDRLLLQQIGQQGHFVARGRTEARHIPIHPSALITYPQIRSMMSEPHPHRIAKDFQLEAGIGPAKFHVLHPTLRALLEHFPCQPLPKRQ